MLETELLESMKKILDRFNTEENRKKLRKWNKTIAFTFNDLQKTYIVSINEGIPYGPTEKTLENADIWVKIDSTTWFGIYNGSISAMQAYINGKITIKGNMADLLKLQQLL